jgi:hypothetical protein
MLSLNKLLKITLVLVLVFVQDLHAQVTVNVDITTPTNEHLQRSEFTVMQGDSTIEFAIIPSHYQFTLPEAGTYEISVANTDYSPYNASLSLSNDTSIVITLKPEAQVHELQEVVVQARMPRKITATGEIFKLSQTAKKSGDPFKALSEIPLLNVDIVNQTITTNAGEQLLILIDGKLQNSGIQPIDPKYIESVEVTEVVSARFLKMGVKKILNVKLRKERPMYVYTDVRTRHDIPLREGFGGANFELGHKKFAVSGSAFYNYLHDDKSDFTRNEQSAEVLRNVTGDRINGDHSWNGSLLMKWAPREADYFSAIVKGLSERDNNEQHAEGQYIGMTNYQLNTDFWNKTTSDGVLAALYHEHTFRNNAILTSFLKYNRSNASATETLYECYDNAEYEYLVNYKTRRNQYTLSLDFDTQDQPYGDINLGNEFEYTADRDINLLELSSLPIHTNRWSNYTYVGYSNSWKKLFYMASVGVENLGVKVLEHQNICWRPRIATSLTLRLPSRQSLRLFYQLDNNLPPSSTLIKLNTSTNPMLRLEGNPYLVPEQEHLLAMKYSLDMKRVRVSFESSHTQKKDIIESYIFSNGETQVQSYRNNGTYKETQIGGNARYGGKKVILFAAATYTWQNYNGQPTKGSVGVNGYIRWDFNNFFIYSKISWQDKEYTSISTIRYDNPVQAHVQIAWQATKNIYLSLGLPYFWGVKSQTTSIEQSVYKSWQRDRFKNMSLRPWLLISWTLRKNAKEAILDKMPNL